MKSFHPPSKTLWPFVGLWLAILTVGWMLVTIEHTNERRLLFGMWRNSAFLVGIGMAWIASLTLLLGISRKSFFIGLVISGLFLTALIVLEMVGLLNLISYSELLLGTGGKTKPLGSEPVPRLDVRGLAYQDLSGGIGIPPDPIPFHYKTDRRGFRNDQDRDGADLYLVGDSILVAGLIPFEETITGRLEAELNLSVMNISLIGIGPQRERDLFLGAKLPTTGRLVLHFLFEGNDIVDSAAYPEGQEGKGRKWRLKDRSFINNLLTWLQMKTSPVDPWAMRRIGYIDGRPYRFAWTRETHVGHERELGRICAALGELRDAVIDAGGQYAVVLIPDKIRILGPSCKWPEGSYLNPYEQHLSPLRDHVILWCRRESVEFLDLTEPLLEAARSGRIPWFPLDTHPNEIGHEVMAKAILQWGLVSKLRTRRAAHP